MLLLLPALLAVQTTPLDAFRGNIAAIHARNRAAYLSHYLHTPALGRVGPDGLRQGYDSFAAGVGAAWPDTLVATHFRIVPVTPGVASRGARRCDPGRRHGRRSGAERRGRDPRREDRLRGTTPALSRSRRRR